MSIKIRTRLGGQTHNIGETINVVFDPGILPGWARRDPDIVAACACDLAFRVSVFAADSAQTRRLVVREARRRAERVSVDGQE
jgi:hypothetical protein